MNDRRVAFNIDREPASVGKPTTSTSPGTPCARAHEEILKQMTLSSLVTVATIAWAREPREEERLRRSLSTLERAGLRIALADRGSNPAFSQYLSGMKRVRVTVPTRDGLVPQVQASIELALERRTPFVLYTEPDKLEFFDGPLLEFVGAAVGDATDGLTLAARSAETFATFPETQRYTEGVINELLGRLLEVPGDYSYGPFLMPRVLAADVLTIDHTLGWGWRPHIFRAAHRRGLRIGFVDRASACPAGERLDHDEERRHRIRQLSQNLSGLLT